MNFSTMMRKKIVKGRRITLEMLETITKLHSSKEEVSTRTIRKLVLKKRGTGKNKDLKIIYWEDLICKFFTIDMLKSGWFSAQFLDWIKKMLVYFLSPPWLWQCHQLTMLETMLATIFWVNFKVHFAFNIDEDKKERI